MRNINYVIFRRNLLEPNPPVFVAIGPEAGDDTIRRCIEEFVQSVNHWRWEGAGQTPGD